MKIIRYAFSALVLIAANTTANAATVTQLFDLGDMVSTTTFSQDFEADINTAQFEFDAAAFTVSAFLATEGETTSGDFVLADYPDVPLGVNFLTDVFEVGLFFGNDDPVPDTSGNFNGVFNVTLEIFDAVNASLGFVSVQSNGNDFVDQFIGLRSDMLIASAMISYQDIDLAIVIDDFTIGINGPVSAVPVPAALPLMGTGLAIMGFLGWRRKRRAT